MLDLLFTFCIIANGRWGTNPPAALNTTTFQENAAMSFHDHIVTDPGPEVWKQIDGFPMYDVSNMGRVRSWYNNKWGRRSIPKLLKQRLFNGYLIAGLLDTVRHRTLVKFVHSLMGTAFKGACPDGLVWRHLNDIKLDLRLSNLVHGTYLQNFADAHANGCWPEGETHYGAKLSTAQVLEIYRRAREGESITLIGAEFGFSASHVFAIKNGFIRRMETEGLRNRPRPNSKRGMAIAAQQDNAS